MFEFFMLAAVFGIIFGTTFVITRLMLPGLLQVITKAGFVRPNYREEAVPMGVGLVFFLACMPVGVGLMAILPSLSRQLPLFLLGIATMSLVGLIDDVLGNRATSGLRGHFSKLFLKGELTTGAIKAIIGGILGLGIALAATPGGSLGGNPGDSPGGNPAGILLQALTITLSINAVNLLDLRPGRAGKGFALAALVLVILSWPWVFHPEIVFLIMVLGSLLAYLPKDLKAQAMMGDAGANALGVTLGVVSSWILPPQGLLVNLIVLLMLHILTERYSLTEYIEKIPVLRFLDNLGRQ